MSRLRFEILGSGSSGGVPRLGGRDGAGDWGACDPNEPKNRRMRCSILVRREHAEHGFANEHATAVLVDTSPDLRAQLLAARCSRLDGVLITHDHADQTHGLDDLRAIALQARQRVPVHIDPETAGALLERFRYCFEAAAGGGYPAILDRIDMPVAGERFSVNGPSGPIEARAFRQNHGNVDSLGFRFGDTAYSSDVVALPEESFDILKGVRTWIVDALQYAPHKTHAHLDLALEWIARVKPERAILTNLHIHMDYRTLLDSLPAGVFPAFDGMTLDGDG